MAKYSTGGESDRSSGGACELCGYESDDLQTATVAGATLSVCDDCAPHDDDADDEQEGRDQAGRSEEERRRRAAQNVAHLSDAGESEDDYWVEDGTDYESDALPYLVSDYGERVERARREAGFQRDELAETLGAEENDLLAVEQGRATQADVGGSVIRALEDYLDVGLVESD
jgi:ribosome-binding protein aMBF1 (putative translation factor)